eukprot:2059151-Amphidinium_carterae.1
MFEQTSVFRSVPMEGIDFARACFPVINFSLIWFVQSAKASDTGTRNMTSQSPKTDLGYPEFDQIREPSRAVQMQSSKDQVSQAMEASQLYSGHRMVLESHDFESAISL